MMKAYDLDIVIVLGGLNSCIDITYSRMLRIKTVNDVSSFLSHSSLFVSCIWKNGAQNHKIVQYVLYCKHVNTIFLESLIPIRDSDINMFWVRNKLWHWCRIRSI